MRVASRHTSEAAQADTDRGRTVWQVTKAGRMQPLVRLLQSRSEAVHGAAAAALEVLTMDDARRQELQQSLPALPP